MIRHQINTNELKKVCSNRHGFRSAGHIESVKGPLIKASIPGAHIGQLVEISNNNNLKAKVVGFEKHISILCPLGSTDKIIPGCKVKTLDNSEILWGSEKLLGSVLNSEGQVIDKIENKTFPKLKKSILIPDNLAPSPLDRLGINEVLETKIKAIDGFNTIGFGQRMAIFAEPGVGKTTLLANITKENNADINVIALIGERGREVQEFINQKLSVESRKKTIIIASTSNEPAIARIQASLLATSIAEYFRDQKLNVVLVLDSLTRLFRAFREVGLAAGEIPVRRGYPPSAYENLPKLIERAGKTKHGSITAFYSVLLSGQLDEDPMVEEVKGLTDGHIILRNKIAQSGRYPAISILESLSRLQTELVSKEMLSALNTIKKFKSEFDQDKDLMMLSNNNAEKLEKAVILDSMLKEILKQNGEFSNLEKELTLLATAINDEYYG